MVRKEPLEVENPREALRDEDGTFKVISPYGQIFRVTCRKGRNMRIREIGHVENTGLENTGLENAGLSEVAHHDRFDGPGYQPTSRRWQIEKIA